MQCPACENQLTPITIGNMTVDVCQDGCGGIWFDRFELQKVDEQHEAAGEQLLDIKRDPNMTVDHEKRRTCPKCSNVIMMRHFFTPKHEIEVDECPQCAGMWLDQGELAVIRTQFATEEERKQAVQQCFSDLFDTDLDKIKAESEEKTEKTRKVARMLRWICPTYWMPGKQDWGAF